jgi:SLT domain-containing protein
MGDILKGTDNVAAASNYIDKRYGSPYNTPYYASGTFDWRGVRGYAQGGWINRPTLFVDQQTMAPYAQAGEAGPEYVMPAGRVGGGDVYVDLRGAQSYDGHRFEDLMVRTLSRADLRGRLTFISGGR